MPLTVTFEETGETRTVRSLCRRCYGHAISVPDVEDELQIVSPYGFAHKAHEYNEGHTECGVDATGNDWWWRY